MIVILCKKGKFYFLFLFKKLFFIQKTPGHCHFTIFYDLKKQEFWQSADKLNL